MTLPDRSSTPATADATRRAATWPWAAAGLLLAAGSALAQIPAGAPAEPAAAPSTLDTLIAAPAPVRVGDATRELFARQASGAWASPTPRPIAGDVAQKSYERYLKTFDYPIPQTFTSTVRSSSGSGGGGGGSNGP